MTHKVTLVCTHRLNEILDFENWKKKIEGEGNGGSDNCGGRAKGGLTTRKRPQRINSVGNF